MTLAALTNPIAWPGHGLNCRPVTASIGTLATLDAAGEYVAYVFQATEAMTVSHVGFRCGAATASPTADIRVETVDATTGFPSGTLWAVNTNIVTGALSANTTAMFALTASASIAAGEWYAIKIAFNGGTSFVVTSGANTTINAIQPYTAINTGTPTLAALAHNPILGVGSGATALYFLPYCYMATSIAVVAFDNSTAGAMRGLRFTPPFACYLSGITYGAASPLLVDRDLELYTDAGTLIKSTSIDGDIHGTTSAAMFIDRFDVPQQLTAGTTYRIVLEPTEATNVRYASLVLGNGAYRSGIPGGTAIQYTTFTTAGGWVDSDVTTIALWDLMLSQLDTGVSAARSRIQSGF